MKSHKRLAQMSARMEVSGYRSPVRIEPKGLQSRSMLIMSALGIKDGVSASISRLKVDCNGMSLRKGRLQDKLPTKDFLQNAVEVLNGRYVRYLERLTRVRNSMARSKVNGISPNVMARMQNRASRYVTVLSVTLARSTKFDAIIRETKV